MEIKQAQDIIKAAIEANPQHVLAVCLGFCPEINDTVNTPAVRAADGPKTGIAALAVRYACTSNFAPLGSVEDRLLAIASLLAN